MAASEKPEKTAYVYMVRCAGGQLYTGWTNDPEARLKAHQSGKGAKGFNVRIANWDERGNRSPYPHSKGEFRTGSR